MAPPALSVRGPFMGREGKPPSRRAAGSLSSPVDFHQRPGNNPATPETAS